MVRQHLPTEILLQVISYIPDDEFAQSTLHKLCLVDRQWYDASLARLYEYPKIKPTNFELFVRTLCPSIILRIKKSDLGSLVKVLDLQHIVHHGSKKITARLLGRTKPSLEVFIAPQSSFAINSWPAIAHCNHLRVLDLSLVCESITFMDLRRSTTALPSLKVLYLPRAGVITDRVAATIQEPWPNLTELHLAGRLDAYFTLSMASPHGLLPTSLTRLSLSNSPALNATLACTLFDLIGPQLRNLTICSLPHIQIGGIDDVLSLCPGLVKLSIAVEMLTPAFASPSMRVPKRKRPPSPHPLRDLRIVRTSDIVDEEVITPLVIDISIELGFLGNLRRVVVNQFTGWTTDRDLLQEMGDLSNSLNLACAQDILEAKEGAYGLQIERSVERNSRPLLDW